jgi:hypothetical protein
MVSGGATVIGSATADSQFATLLLQSLQQEAIQHAVHEATTSWLDSLDRKDRRNKNTKLVAQAHSRAAPLPDESAWPEAVHASVREAMPCYERLHGLAL